MGLAVPSLVEASRGLPSVKADAPSADHDLVTSVAIAPPAIDEPVSPELALVDPELAARLRALLPELEPQIPLELPPPVLRVLPAPEAEEVPPLAPLMPLGGAAASPAPAPPVYSRTERLWSLAKAFVLGAAVATVVTVGVVSEMGEGPPAQADEAITVPPSAAPAAPARTSGGAASKPTTTKSPPATQPRRGGSAAQSSTGVQAKQGRAGAKQLRPASKLPSQSKPSTVKQPVGSAQPAQVEQAPKQSPTQKPATKAEQTKPAAAAPDTRRFAWAPVEGAVGYRVELFRGDKQVLIANTRSPVYELASRWRHRGRAERLIPGSYRWYVWPVLRDGRAGTAVVQAKLSIP
jgi:hypothetical protein